LTTRRRKSHFKRIAQNWGPDKSDKDAIATRSKCWREGGRRQKEEKKRNKAQKSILKEAGVLFVLIFIPKHVQLVSLSGEGDILGY